MLAGALAITQESSGVSDEEPSAVDNTLPPDTVLSEAPEIPPAPVLPDWVTPAQWYRSNSAGMMLEENPSRLAAMRNEYALVRDFIGHDELPAILLPYYTEQYIQVRVLYHNGDEYRRQWIFRDADGLYRLVAVFTKNDDTNAAQNTDEAAANENPADANAAQNTSEAAADSSAAPGDTAASSIDTSTGSVDAAVGAADTSAGSADAAASVTDANAGSTAAAVDAANASVGSADAPGVTDASAGSAAAAVGAADTASDGSAAAGAGDTGTASAGSGAGIADDVSGDHRIPMYKNYSGFIEIYDSDSLIEREITFTGDTDVRETKYIYNNGTLIRAEAMQDTGAGTESAPKMLYTDNYRYNRSGSLRYIERSYTERLDSEKTLIRFPNRVLDTASQGLIVSDQLYPSSGLFDEFSVEPDQKMVYTTDDRNRILTQSLLDSDGNVLWVIQNTWSGERIVSAMKTEGDDTRLNDYEYNNDGALITERNFYNGELQRQVNISGNREVEELYINGAAVLRATWEDGRKVSEERLRPGGNMRTTQALQPDPQRQQQLEHKELEKQVQLLIQQEQQAQEQPQQGQEQQQAPEQQVPADTQAAPDEPVQAGEGDQ